MGTRVAATWAGWRPSGKLMYSLFAVSGTPGRAPKNSALWETSGDRKLVGGHRKYGKVP